LALDDVEGLLFVHNDANNTLWMLNAVTGAVISTVTTGGNTLPGGPVLTKGDKKVYVQLAPPYGASAGQEWVQCYSYATGALTLLWSCQLPDCNNAVAENENSPAIADSHLYVASQLLANGTSFVFCFGTELGPPPFVPEFFTSIMPALIILAVTPVFYYYAVKLKQSTPP
jgi:hypothetical protein